MIISIPVLVMVIFVLGGATAARRDPTKHLCSKVMAGNFSNLALKSITFYGYNKVVIFEDKFQYEIPIEKVTAKSMEIPDTQLPWSDTNLRDAERKVKEKMTEGEVIKSVYMLKRDEALKYFITSNAKRYGLHNLRNIQCELKTVRPLEGLADFSLVHDQKIYYRTKGYWLLKIKEDWSDTYGYVIHKDIYQGTANFVMYNLVLVDGGWSVGLQNSREPNPLGQYHLELTENPGEILFVHSSLYETKSRKYQESSRLFSILPRGFLYDGRMYLFDSGLGCVYIVQGWNRVDLDEKHKKGADQFVQARVNVPYEQFFKCPEKYNLIKNFSGSDNRCEISNRTGANGPTSKDGFQMWYIYAGAIVLVLLIGFFALMVIRVGCRDISSTTRKGQKQIPKKAPTKKKTSKPVQSTLSLLDSALSPGAVSQSAKKSKSKNDSLDLHNQSNLNSRTEQSESSKSYVSESTSRKSTLSSAAGTSTGNLMASTGGSQVAQVPTMRNMSGKTNNSGASNLIGTSRKSDASGV